MHNAHTQLQNRTTANITIDVAATDVQLITLECVQYNTHIPSLYHHNIALKYVHTFNVYRNYFYNTRQYYSLIRARHVSNTN